MIFLKKISQSTQWQNRALLVILGLLIIETGLIVTTITNNLPTPSLSELYRHTSIVLHLRLIVALAVVAIIIPSTTKRPLIAPISQVFKSNQNIIRCAKGSLSWLSKAWRIHILLLPLIVFNILGLVVLMEQSPWLTPDSIEFLNFAPWRTAAYPLFF